MTQPRHAPQNNKKSFGFLLSSFALIFVVLIASAGLGFLYFNYPKPKKSTIEVLSREGVISKIQSVNRLQTVVYNVDTVINTQKEGNWYALWQDEQKGLFIAHGRVLAGVDLSLLKPEHIHISEDKKQVVITLPPAQIFETYLDNIEVYDLQTGLFGMLNADPHIFQQAQEAGKKQVLDTACRSNILMLATDNAQKQVQSLFALAQVTVTVNTSPSRPCS